MNIFQKVGMDLFNVLDPWSEHDVLSFLFPVGSAWVLVGRTVRIVVRPRGLLRTIRRVVAWLITAVTNNSSIGASGVSIIPNRGTITREVLVISTTSAVASLS